MARFATLYSGSSGNSAAVAHTPVAGGEEFLLVDVGKNCKQALLAMQQLELDVRRLCGILVTHEHSDHISGLKVFLKKHAVPVYGSAATLDELARQDAVPPTARLIAIDGRREDIGGFGVEAFGTSHDSAGCCGFHIECADGHTMSIATDLGWVSRPVYDRLCGCGLVALECNYDKTMLQMGPYPYYLKSRILSTRGHLSNDDCAAVLADLLADGCTRFALCHLSQENNIPELARATVMERLLADGRFVPEQLAAGALTLQVSPRHSASDWIEF